MTDDNGWDEWRNVVKIHMKDTHQGISDIRSQMADIKVSIGELQVKSGVWGFIAGAIPTIGLILFLMLKNHI